MENSRLKNSALNFSSGLVGRGLTITLNFIVRTIFIYCLNEAYLSVNGLYSNILTVLSLAELGFGSAMVYHMYAPMACHDYQRAAALLHLYKRVYQIIGAVIFVLGLFIVPFLDVIIKDKPDVPGLTLYYLMFLFNTVISYWLQSYMGVLFSADQKEYVKTNTQSVVSIVQAIIQIIILLLFRNYLLYLFIQLCGTAATNLYVARLAKTKYQKIVDCDSTELQVNERRQIKIDAESLLLSRIGHVALNGTDNIIVSAVVGVLWVGRLSNYSLICDSITSILCQVTGAMTGSLGNFFATEKRKRGYEVFKRIEFLNFWLYGFSFIALVLLLDPFMSLWAGERFVLGLSISIAVALNFFVAGYMNVLWIFRSTLGLFEQGKFRPLIVASLNIVLSIVLGKIWGVFGVLFATFLSRASINLWYDPIILHKYGFGVSARPFFYTYLKRVLLIVMIIIPMLFIRESLFSTGIALFNFSIMVLATAFIPNGIFWIVFHKMKEYQFFKDIVNKRIILLLRR